MQSTLFSFVMYLALGAGLKRPLFLCLNGDLLIQVRYVPSLTF